jgi:GNAT superfamily N-acetyltransferase
MIIRNVHPADLPYLYDICAKTAFNGGDARHLLSDPLIIGQYFLAPYVIFNPDWCWVVEQDNRLLGYLVSTPDSEIFANWMTSNWLFAVRQLYPISAQQKFSRYETWLRKLIHEIPKLEIFVRDFPAHLHIDLLPEAQGKRLGSKLMTLFEQKLIENKISGYHLAMSADNSAGKFYESNGLTVLKQEPFVIFYGKQF